MKPSNLKRAGSCLTLRYLYIYTLQAFRKQWHQKREGIGGAWVVWRWAVSPHLATSRSGSDWTRTQPSPAHSSCTSSSQGLAKRKTYLWYRIKDNMGGFIYGDPCLSLQTICSPSRRQPQPSWEECWCFPRHRADSGGVGTGSSGEFKNTEAQAVH